MSEDSVAYELSRDIGFQRLILPTVNYAGKFCAMNGIGKDEWEGMDWVIVESVLKRAIELYIEHKLGEG